MFLKILAFFEPIGRPFGRRESGSSGKWRGSGIAQAPARAVVPLCLLAVFCPFVLGQPPNDPDALRILAGALQAHGGAKALSEAHDLRITGVFTVPKPEGQAAAYRADIRVQGSFRLWVRTTGPDGDRVYVSDGEGAWVVHAGEKRFLTKEEAGNRLFEINPAAGLLRAFARGSLAARYRGSVKQGGIPLDKVLALLPDTPQAVVSVEREYEVLVDPETSLIESIAFDAVTPKGPEPDSREAFHYADYRPAVGLLVPFRVDHYLNDRQVSSFTVDEVEIQRHPDSLFLEPQP